MAGFNPRFGRPLPGVSACPRVALYRVVAPGEPGNPGTRWMFTKEAEYAKALETGRHTYTAGFYATEAAAVDRVTRLNTPLFPPTNPDMPLDEYWRLVAASKADIKAAKAATERRARERAPFGKPMFDLPVDRVPHTYPAIPALDPEVTP